MQLIFPSHSSSKQFSSLSFSEIRLENTNICAYSCFFCPREKLTRPKGFMTNQDLSIVLQQIDQEYSGIIDLHGYGEPLLDKYLPEKIKLVRNRTPKSIIRIISTLGVPVSSDYIKKIIDNKISNIEISFYGYDQRSYFLSHKVDNFNIAKRNIELLVKYKDLNNSNLKIIMRAFPVHNTIKQPGITFESRRKFLDWLKDLKIEVIKERAMHNYGTGRSYIKKHHTQTCSITWGYRKRILQITWDLKIIPCCFDFNGEIVLGDLHKQSISEIFSSNIYSDFIISHVSNNLDNYPICKTCERCIEC